MYKRVITMFALVLLGGCANLSPAERSAAMQQEVEEMIQVYGPACEKLGYQADTDAWRECILKLNKTKSLEYYNSRRSAECLGYRGFYRCDPF